MNRGPKQRTRGSKEETNEDRSINKETSSGINIVKHTAVRASSPYLFQASANDGLSLMSVGKPPGRPGPKEAGSELHGGKPTPDHRVNPVAYSPNASGGASSTADATSPTSHR